MLASAYFDQISKVPFTNHNETPSFIIHSTYCDFTSGTKMSSSDEDSKIDLLVNANSPSLSKAKHNFHLLSILDEPIQLIVHFEKNLKDIQFWSNFKRSKS